MKIGDGYKHVAKRVFHVTVVCLIGSFVALCFVRLWWHIKPVSTGTTACTPFYARLDLSVALLCESDTGSLYYLYFTHIREDGGWYEAGRFPRQADGRGTGTRWENVSIGWKLMFIGSRYGIHVGDMRLEWMPPSNVLFDDDVLQRVALIPVSELSNPSATNGLEWIVLEVRPRCVLQADTGMEESRLVGQGL